MPFLVAKSSFRMHYRASARKNRIKIHTSFFYLAGTNRSYSKIHHLFTRKNGVSIHMADAGSAILGNLWGGQGNLLSQMRNTWYLDAPLNMRRTFFSDWAMWKWRGKVERTRSQPKQENWTQSQRNYPKNATNRVTNNTSKSQPHHNIALELLKFFRKWTTK